MAVMEVAGMKGRTRVANHSSGGSHVSADVGDMAVLDRNNEVYAGVGKGLEDFGVGVIDFDLVYESGLRS
ncbi:hypothetical protein Pyn_00721 [Prunus yedoensis var. nudiflora]|uniref:Uncharacterized protein n=1 Tax=Prunus yedoensis var. nudiflora TaxID=2094558 RepID=A0A314Z9Y9_PRUYE|nr:hypothetical protein Pyn_00721 [Prunus yedoensis var. nudiflora]